MTEPLTRPELLDLASTLPDDEWRKLTERERLAELEQFEIDRYEVER